MPTGEKDPKLIGNVILLQNITPYKELDFAKTNFIAMVSHELKTPISSIQMGVQLMENEVIGTLNPEQKELLAGIREDAARLLKITGELLNLTQVESGQIQLNLVPVTCGEIAEAAIAANHAAAERKHIRVEINAEAGIPQVVADKEKTTWVLINLVANAIRYSYDNSRVEVSIVRKAGDVWFAVKDTGQGIAPEYLDKIFSRYFRVPGSGKEGTGLGLSISKELIEAQHGTLRVESEYGAGSTFYFSLPVAG
jgi:signal transduction histidine kinase